MKYEIRKRLKETDDRWRSAFHGAVFNEQARAEESMQKATASHPKYEYKMVEWPLPVDQKEDLG